MGKLDGKVAIVTGSGRGLGRAFTKGMAKEFASLVINDVDDSAHAVSKEIKDNIEKRIYFMPLRILYAYSITNTIHKGFGRFG